MSEKEIPDELMEQYKQETGKLPWFRGKPHPEFEEWLISRGFYADLPLCSEIATKRILKEHGLPTSLLTLEKCQSLEHMIPCVVNRIEKQIHHPVTPMPKNKAPICKLETAFDINRVIDLVKTKKGGVAIKISEPNKPAPTHTIRLTKFENNEFTFDDETGEHKISKDKLEKIRSNFIFYCDEAR